MNVDPSDDGYDGHCINCGAGYHFDIGFSLNTCHACGKSRDKTPAQEQEEQNRPAPDPCESVADHLDGELFFIDMTLEAPVEAAPTREQAAKLTKVRALLEQARRIL